LRFGSLKAEGLNGYDGVKFWDFDTYDWIDRYDERMRASRRLCYEETIRRLPECAQAQPGERVLDLGTGTGNSAVPFLERGCTVVGLDPSERMLSHARAKAEHWAGRFTVQQAGDPFLRVPFPDSSFDIVVAAYAIHHLPDDAKRQAIREARRVLRPGGRIGVADTMFRDAAHKARALQEHRDLDDEYQPLLTTFPAMFEAEGFRVTMSQIGDLTWIVIARR